jgi:hypothetical protein
LPPLLPLLLLFCIIGWRLCNNKQGVGSAWGAEAFVLPPAPRFLDMQELLSEAKACDATLLLMLDDSTTANGQLQVRAVGCLLREDVNSSCPLCLWMLAFHSWLRSIRRHG